MLRGHPNFFMLVPGGSIRLGNLRALLQTALPYQKL
jgi:hypothetical protein